MIIESLLDTDLYKFTMMQVVLHHFHGSAGRISLQVPHAGRRPDAVHRRDRARDRRACADCALRDASSNTCAAGAFSRATSSICSGFSISQRALRQHQAVRDGVQRNRHHDQRAVAAHDPVRGAGAGDRERGLLPQHAAAARPRRRTPPARGQDRADQRGPRSGVSHRRLRHAPPLLRGMAGRSGPRAEAGHRLEVRRHQQRLLRPRART